MPKIILSRTSERVLVLPTSFAFVIITSAAQLPPLVYLFYRLFCMRAYGGSRAYHCGHVMVTLRTELAYCIKTMRNKSKFM